MPEGNKVVDVSALIARDHVARCATRQQRNQQQAEQRKRLWQQSTLLGRASAALQRVVGRGR